jgi:hypothetical protein
MFLCALCVGSEKREDLLTVLPRRAFCVFSRLKIGFLVCVENSGSLFFSQKLLTSSPTRQGITPSVR